MNVGDGVRYLTRHVARGDVDQAVTDGGATPLTRYYTASGYPPGTWVGSGVAGLAKPEAIDGEVEEWRLAALFAEGRDPTSGLHLGRPPRRFTTLEERVAAQTAALPATLTASERDAEIDRIRTAEERKPHRSAIGGFDLTFTASKSVSALWAVADAPVQQVIVDAHHATVRDLIDYLEREVIFTRTGYAGVAQVDTRGIIAAAFDHWDSRGGDPNLHTHLIVANRVQSIEGAWLTIDSRGLHHAVHAASELYDAMLADRLTRDLGVGWEPRERASRRTVAHEITGIPEPLIEEFSARSEQITTIYDELHAAFVATNGRNPSNAERSRLRQQATLTSRPAKTGPVALPELCNQWRTRATHATGLDAHELVDDALDQHTSSPERADTVGDIDREALAQLALAAVQSRRSTWNRWNLMTEVLRLSHDRRFATPADREAFTASVVDIATDLSVALTTPVQPVTSPDLLRRTSGENIFSQHAGARYTSHAILGAEAYLGDRSNATTGPTAVFDRTMTGDLSEDQAAAVAQIAGSAADLQVLIGPAGSGKTTALAALRDQWVATHGNGSVIGLAPSAAAAQVLAESLNVPCENTTKWLHESAGAGAHHRAETRARLAAALKRARTPAARDRLSTTLQQVITNQQRWILRPGQLVIVDEASLAGTLSLAVLARQAESAGAKLLLVGDHAQLTAVEAGGAFRMLAAAPTTASLSNIWRFRAEWERDASLALRTGDANVLDVYNHHGRLHDGDHASMLDAAYSAWLSDTGNGLVSLLVAADNGTVRALNDQARRDLVAAGTVEHEGVELTDGLHAGVGDRIVTRRNRRDLADSTGWVRNGDTYFVRARSPLGDLTVHRAGADDSDLIILPADYVATHVNLAYATTAHRAQGTTVDTAHTVVTSGLARENLYVSMTRGRAGNHAWVALDDPHEDPDDAQHVQRPRSSYDVLRAVLQRSDAERSATDTALDSSRAAESMSTLIPTYEHIAHQLSTQKWEPVVARLTSIDDVRNHDAWPRTVGLLRSTTLAGLDTIQILTDAVKAAGDLSDAPDPLAKISGHLAAAVTSHAPSAQPIRYLAGLIVPAETPDDPAVHAALEQTAIAIRQRATNLVHRASANGEPWLQSLGDRPESHSALQLWDEAAAAVATYRDRWNISDVRPLGPSSGSDRARQRDYLRAQRALTALDQTPSDERTRQLDEHDAATPDHHPSPDRNLT